MSGQRRVSALHEDIVRLIKEYELQSYRSYGLRAKVSAANELEDHEFILVGSILGADVEPFCFEFSRGVEWRYWAKRDKTNNILVLQYPWRVTTNCMTDWVPLKEMYLRQHNPFDANKRCRRDKQYQFFIRNLHQIRWWNKNGKTFDFLGLPRELRDEIYKLCIGDPIRPCPRPLVLPEEKRYIKTFSFYSLFTVNRQIGEEIRQQCSGYVQDDMKVAMETKRELEAEWALAEQQRFQRESLAPSGPSACEDTNHGGNDSESEMYNGDGEAAVSALNPGVMAEELFVGDLIEFSSDEGSISDLITFSDDGDIGDLMFFDEE